MITALLKIKFFIMKKQMLNLGKALNKAEQKSINGGIRKKSLFCEEGEYPPACIPVRG